MPIEQPKYAVYAAIILEKIQELIEEEGLEEELSESENATAFIHAFSTAAPCLFFNSYTNANKDWLGFNHVANRLILQLSTKPKEGKTIKY